MSKKKTFDRVVMERDANEFFNALWGLKPTAVHNPSPTPVTIRKEDLSSWTKPFRHLVAEKTDGERASLLFARTEYSDEPYVVLIRRNRQLIFVDVGHVNDSLYNGTLLDGEWVDDSKHYRAFDLVVYEGYNKKKKPFTERLETAKEAISHFVPKNWTVDVKPFYELNDLHKLQEQIERGNRGKTDGFIFMPKNDPIVTGRADNIKKWKPVLENTVDLLYTKEQGWTCVGEDGGISPYTLNLNGGTEREGIFELKPLGDGTWEIYKQREDKRVPNHISTVRKTIETIEEGIQLSDLKKSFQ